MTRTQSFIIFFSIVLTLYGLLNTYIFIRGLQVIPHISPWRVWFIVGFWMLSFTYLAARILERFLFESLSTALIWIGSFWLGAMAYFIVLLIAVDIVRLANFFIPFFPAMMMQNVQKVKEWTAIGIVGVAAVAVIGSYINADSPRIRTLNCTIHKASPLKSLNIVMASDIHLGIIISNSHLEKIVKIINSLNPDIVLLPGDIVDEDIAPVIRQNLGETLRQIKSRYGTYAVTGNHEYIGGVEAACSYLSDHGIVMLRDSAVVIDNAFVLAGREDASRRQFGGQHRKTVHELLEGMHASLPVILMDHQPLHLEEAEHAGVDLQLSGHTHNGQLWPFNYIAEAVYELSWGYKQKGATHYYVSCGVGTWGPPMRSGNSPEIVNIRLIFE